jgi:hypothetical protein
VTETCADDGPNVITDVATVPAANAGTLALARIHARLERRACSPPSTSSMAATPPWPAWSGPGASIRSPSPGRCPATAPASLARDAAVDPEIRRRTLGHADAAMTAHYTHIEAEAHKAAAEAVAKLVESASS